MARAWVQGMGARAAALLLCGIAGSCSEREPPLAVEAGSAPSSLDAALASDIDAELAVEIDAAADAGRKPDTRAPVGQDATSVKLGDAASGDAGSPGGATGRPGWLIESGDSVFFVGNSFFGGDDNRLADLVANLAREVQPPIEIHTGQHVVYGNQPLAWFFQQPESQRAIASGQYKIFVLQGEEREPVDHEEDFKQAVRDYHRAVSDHGGEIMLFMTWDFYWERDSSFFAELSRAYDELGRELNVPVIPVGLIYDDTNQQPYPGQEPYWLTSQDLHQNDEGTVANVYATFEMLTGIDPMGKTFVIPYADPPVPQAIYEYLSEKSWARVAPRLHD